MLRDFVEEIVNAPGSSATINLAGPPTGRKAWISASTFSDGDQAYYVLTDNGANYEFGVATLAAGSPNTLTRTTVRGNSAGTTSRLNFTGTCRVYNWAISSALAIRLANGAISLGGDALGGAIWCNTAGGTANAITVSPAVALAGNTAGAAVEFVATATNTGTATLQVGSLAALPLIRLSSAVLRAGDILSGQFVRAVCDGFSWRIMHSIPHEIGELVDYTGGDLPPDFVFPDGRNILRSDAPAYAALMASAGFPYGNGNGTTTMTLPDLRGRVTIGRDNLGGTAANRVTAAGSGITGTTVGATGGSQFSQAHIHDPVDPGHTHGATVSDPQHAHQIVGGVINAGGTGVGGSGTGQPGNGFTQNAATGIGVSIGSATTGIGLLASGTGSSQNMPPAIVLPKIMYVGH